MNKMTSRQRVLAALSLKPVDYIPCSPFFNPLRHQQRCGYKWQFPWGPSLRERIEYCVEELGVDPVVNISIGSYFPNTDVSSRVWVDNSSEKAILHKVWETPSGELHSSVRYNNLWPHGMDIPFYSDFNVGHAVEPWITSMSDLECLRHIMLPPRTKEHIDQLDFFFAESKFLTDRLQLATFASIGMGLTGAQHLFGTEQLCLLTIDQPDLVDEYLELEHQLNLSKLEIAGKFGVDIIGRNGFYETADFYSPKMLEQFLGKRLRKEINLAHQSGSIIGYTVHTGIMPMLDYLEKLDFDCIMNIDTGFKDVDLVKIYGRLGKKKSFWIGPSNTYHMWDKDPDVVRKAVRYVFEVFGQRKTGLLITACPSAHSIMPWENTLAMIDEWKKLNQQYH